MSAERQPRKEQQREHNDGSYILAFGKHIMKILPSMIHMPILHRWKARGLWLRPIQADECYSTSVSLQRCGSFSKIIMWSSPTSCDLVWHVFLIGFDGLHWLLPYHPFLEGLRVHNSNGTSLESLKKVFETRKRTRPIPQLFITAGHQSGHANLFNGVACSYIAIECGSFVSAETSHI